MTPSFFFAAGASSATSNEDTLVIKPTKYSILDFFDCIASKQVPVDKERYVYKNWTQKELFDMAKRYIPSIGDYCTSRKVADWLSKDGRFGRTTNTRTAGVQTRSRALWALRDEIQDNALQNAFNHQLYQQTVRNSTGWITVGYARKSRSNEKLQTRAVLLQKMVKNLRVKDLCEKVYVLPVCAADSPLLKRDSVPTASAMVIMGKLRHKDGDLQDLIMFATTTNFLATSFHRLELRLLNR